MPGPNVLRALHYADGLAAETERGVALRGQFEDEDLKT
jgi:hypothetical protein